MAIIGLLDWDLTRWRRPIVFNLELMKLSTYHKSILRDIVQMEQAFSSAECSKVYIQKDYEDYFYPPEITSDPKVVWGGLALSGNSYVPMELNIERCSADLSIYNKMKKYYNATSERRRIFSTMMKAQHLRLSLDGKTCFDQWEKQLLPPDEKRIPYFIFHDKDIVKVQDADQKIRYLWDKYGRRNSRFGFKFPLVMETEQDVERWANLPKIKDIANLVFHSLMPDELIESLSLTKQQITYYISNDNWTYEKLLQSISQILLQGIFLSSYSIPLLLKVDRNFIIPDEFRNFLFMLNDYFLMQIQYRFKAQLCPFTFCKYLYDRVERETKVAMFQFFKDNNPDFFDLLYHAESAIYQGGRIVPVHYTIEDVMSKGGFGKFDCRTMESFTLVQSYDWELPETLYWGDKYDTNGNSKEDR